MRITSVQGIFGGDRFAHTGIQCYQFVERSKVRLLVSKVSHANEMQEHTCERRMARTLALAKGSAVDDRTASTYGGKAVCHHQPGIIVRMKFQVFWRQPERVKFVEEAWHTAWQVYI